MDDLCVIVLLKGKLLLDDYLGDFREILKKPTQIVE
jgi:hypothetical protein